MLGDGSDQTGTTSRADGDDIDVLADEEDANSLISLRTVMVAARSSPLTLHRPRKTTAGAARAVGVAAVFLRIWETRRALNKAVKAASWSSIRDLHGNMVVRLVPSRMTSEPVCTMRLSAGLSMLGRVILFCMYQK